MSAPILALGLIAALMLIETWHGHKTKCSDTRNSKRLDRNAATRNAAIEYSNVSRKEVTR